MALLFSDVGRADNGLPGHNAAAEMRDFVIFDNLYSKRFFLADMHGARVVGELLICPAAICPDCSKIRTK